MALNDRGDRCIKDGGYLKMSVNGIGSNYCYMGAVANHVQEKTFVTNAGRKVTEQPVKR